MNTCGDCPRRPAVAALLAGARKGVCAGPLRWKAPRALERRRIDVHRRERAHATGPLKRSGVSSTAVHERCQRVRLGEVTASRQSCGASPHRSRQAHERGSRSTRSPHRAVKREAVGGRMTARWSGVARGSRAPRASAARQAIWKSNVGGFPTALGGSLPR